MFKKDKKNKLQKQIQFEFDIHMGGKIGEADCAV